MATTVDGGIREEERRFFVGRERELAAFRAWLDGDSAAVLSVSGPGGVGKSALLGAFARAAATAGRPVALVDGRAVLPTRADFLAALGHRDLHAAVAAIDAARPLLLVDGFEALAALTRFVREDLVPRLDPAVRVVVAGRQPLGTAWRGGERWPVKVRSLELGRLDASESRELLLRRGVADADLAEQIRAQCGGWPLALSLAADLVDQFGVRRLRSAPEWRLAARELVEQLLDEAAQPALRTAIEAGSTVRQFDEAMLAALIGDEVAADAFAALCRLSVVRPTDRGLALHDDVRRLVADDLRWRHPERHAGLRLRALDHLAARARRAPGPERERLLEERLFLWEHEVARSLLFGRDEPGEVWLEPARDEDADELVALHRRWQDEVRPALALVPADAPWDSERHDAWFRELVTHAGVRIQVARDRSGEAVGYDAVLALCEETLPLAREHPVIGTAVDAYLALDGVPPLPATPGDADVVFLAQLGLGGRLPDATRAVLIRDLLSVLARGGACLCSLDLDEYRRLADALGFRRLPGSETVFRGAEYHGYALDLRRVGVEPWLHALLAGERPPPAGPGEIEAELKDVLAGWHDDARLSASSLAALAAPGHGTGADAVRALVRAALERARSGCASGQEPALRALELAYLERATSHERAAYEIHVSRATFYRLLRRGAVLVADALPQAAATPGAAPDGRHDERPGHD